MGDGPHESENPPRTLLGNALLGTTDPNVLRRAEEGRIEPVTMQLWDVLQRIGRTKRLSGINRSI